MKLSIALTSLILSGLYLNAQNLTNINDQVATNHSNDNNSNYNYRNDINPSYSQYLGNTNMNVQAQSNGNGDLGSSALQSFGNSNNKKTNKVQTQKKVNSNPVVQTQINNIQVSNVVNGGIINTDVNRGNNFNANENVFDNVEGNSNANRGRGGNILVNDININDNIQSNPVVNDTKKIVASKPVVKDFEGLDFKPSGLSGRDYTNGGKLKKGQKNFYTPSGTKHKTVHKKKPSYKKMKHHTSKCAKW